MNFTQEIKRDLLKRAPEKRCCRAALAEAAIVTSGTYSASGFSFTSESEESAAFLLNLTEALGIRMTLTGASFDPKQGRDKLTFSCAAEGFSVRGTQNLSDCCAQAYLKGAFLYGGSCTLPHEGTKTGYHLEVVFDRAEDADDFLTLLDRFQIIGNVVRRGENSVVYLKSREAISDFLAAVGADGALGTLEAVSAAREERNAENRVSNCSAGNADRAAIASVGQVVAFLKLKESGRLDGLAAPLREAAEARLNNPEMTLSELAVELGVGKSCLNHRFRKLMELSRE